ncbi:DUF5984 family protein [Candidatus Parabeggiatoa sp. HSG14]|uniref:DUF5984 family protein n=1 Tax=Candidatus Parabeggiatoa sp. HSG14 TaxID=3055593 RepID=UPI0025A85D6C|nr:DUF5984 family protein [Thiotrichales bacterium HSG14]
MALFEFELTPLDKMTPWGNQSDLSLHWFGLTDGIYYLNVGNEQLFRFSKEILQHWRKEYPKLDGFKDHVDYQVVRLYEDVLEILPDILSPIPTEVYSLIETPLVQKKWIADLTKVLTTEDDNELYETCYQATDWWAYRQLSTIHLNQGPDIWFFRVDDMIHIRWCNDEKKIDGIQPWAALTGDWQLPVAQFIQEIEAFHNRLMKEMGERIEILRTNNPIPHIKIDMDNLVKEHEQRIKPLETVLTSEPRTVNWNEVISTTKTLIQSASSSSCNNACHR